MLTSYARMVLARPLQMVGDVKGGKVGLAKQNLDLHEDEMAIVAMADANAEDEESDSNNSQAPVEGTPFSGLCIF